MLAADRAFFTALVEGDGQALDRIFADQFVLVGVNDGAVVPREVLVALVEQGQLRFEAIDADGSAVLLRRYGSTAIVVGRTQMRGSFDGAPFRAASRYTHVFVGEHQVALASGGETGASHHRVGR